MPKYSKAFNKFYKKHGYAENDIQKEVMFEAWSEAARRVVTRISRINKWSDYNWQHEDVDSLQDYAKELYKDE